MVVARIYLKRLYGCQKLMLKVDKVTLHNCALRMETYAVLNDDVVRTIMFPEVL